MNKTILRAFGKQYPFLWRIADPNKVEAISFPRVTEVNLWDIFRTSLYQGENEPKPNEKSVWIAKGPTGKAPISFKRVEICPAVFQDSVCQQAGDDELTIQKKVERVFGDELLEASLVGSELLNPTIFIVKAKKLLPSRLNARIRWELTLVKPPRKGKMINHIIVFLRSRSVVGSGTT